MKYRLKDRELQKKLDDISNGDFSICLHKGVSKILDVYGLKNIQAKRILSVQVDFGEKTGLTTPPKRCADKRYAVNLLFSEIEQVKEYNPKTWNKFPDVEPPEGVLMRVERSDGYNTCAYFKHFEDGSDWMHSNNLCMPKAMSDLIVRFRPWDDEEQE